MEMYVPRTHSLLNGVWILLTLNEDFQFKGYFVHMLALQELGNNDLNCMIS